MLKFQIRDLIWLTVVASLASMLIISRMSHTRELESLQNQLETATEGFQASYKDIDIYISQKNTGRINFSGPTPVDSQ
jgi:hypothetical protein